MKKEHKDAFTGFMILGAIFWVILVAMKALGAVTMGWLAVMLGILWLPLCIVAVLCLLFVVCTLDAAIRKRLRRRAQDRRIIWQARASGAWDIHPTALGGRALELKAREYGIKRQPGETDAQLRARCMAKVDELTNAER